MNELKVNNYSANLWSELDGEITDISEGPNCSFYRIEGQKLKKRSNGQWVEHKDMPADTYQIETDKFG